jgi:hypothetical protein
VLSLSGPKAGIELSSISEPQSAPPIFTCTWQAGVAYPWGVTYKELFELKLASGKVTGTASFLGVQRGIFEGKLERGDLSFTTRTEQTEGAMTREAKHVYRGKIADDTDRRRLFAASTCGVSRKENTLRRPRAKL